MITVAACGRAEVVVDVWFDDGRASVHELGVGRADGFLVFFTRDNVRAVRGRVEKCTEDGDTFRDDDVVLYNPGRLVGSMLCAVDGEVVLKARNGDVWEWKR